MPTLGKRVGEDALFVSAETGEAACTQKRSKVRRENGEIDSTSAGVNDHPCRKQLKSSIGTAKGLGTLGQFETFAKS